VFWLSFTLDDYLSRAGPAGRAVIVTSASSKAAIGLAHLLAARGVPVIGLTSADHEPFVAGLAVYHQVIPYQCAGDAPAAGAVLVDIAGNAALRDRIQRAHPGRLAETIVAGRAHPEADIDGGEPPVTFFVPDVIRTRARELGWPVLEQRFQAALAGFASAAGSWLNVISHPGLDAVDDLYQSMLGHTAGSPAKAHLIKVRLWISCASSCSWARAGPSGKKPRNR
jgi:Protein of unknown function (DUF2855)